MVQVQVQVRSLTTSFTSSASLVPSAVRNWSLGTDTTSWLAAWSVNRTGTSFSRVRRWVRRALRRPSAKAKWGGHEEAATESLEAAAPDGLPSSSRPRTALPIPGRSTQTIGKRFYLRLLPLPNLKR